MRKLALTLTLAMLVLPLSARASTAYGTLNNFDTVNDTGHECHGFEIEIEDIHSTDITYTYNYNHYGTPKITEDNSNALHPKVHIRYESGKNPDGSWSAFTAIPSGPISPTNGHQFTNPNVNFGGEHFGAGYYGRPTSVRYFWLIDDGAGNLIRDGEVLIGTPTFNYLPPAVNVPARVQADIKPPEPVEVPVKEFGEPLWLKVTTTETHNNNEVELRDLVSDDPDDPNDKNWKNGEPDEVEVEWELLQTEFSKVDGGANGENNGAEQELPDGDEIITRRYDFYRYVGPIDEESGEAKTDNVGADDLHGEGVKTINGVEVDLSTVIVVGDYIGAQMAAFDANANLGLIDRIADGDIDTPYAPRTMVIGGVPPVISTLTGALPAGMEFEPVTGVLSGTPTESGIFTFTLDATDGVGADATVTYDFTIVEAAVEMIPHSTVTTGWLPAEGGSTSGDGDYENGSDVAVTAEASPGYSFVNWTENEEVVSDQSTYEFVIDTNRDLVANFVADPIFRAIGDLVSATETGKSSALDRRTRQLTSHSTVTLTNTSDISIGFPLNLVITNLAAGVSMPDATGVTEVGDVYYDLPAALEQAELLPGESVVVTITFVYPYNRRITYGLEAWGVAP